MSVYIYASKYAPFNISSLRRIVSIQSARYLYYRSSSSLIHLIQTHTVVVYTAEQL